MLNYLEITILIVIKKVLIIIVYHFIGFRAPFNIYVHTDSKEGTASSMESSNRGFCLNFVQRPCTTPYK